MGRAIRCANIGLPGSGAKQILPNAARQLVARVEQLSAAFPPEMPALDRLFGEAATYLLSIIEIVSSCANATLKLKGVS